MRRSVLTLMIAQVSRILQSSYQFVDHYVSGCSWSRKGFAVQDKMAGREIDRGRLAETIRSNQAGEALQARGGKTFPISQAMTGQISQHNAWLWNQQEFGFKMQQAGKGSAVD